MVEETLLSVDLTNLKGILWDLDNTLYEYEPVHQMAYSACKNIAREQYGIEEMQFDLHWNNARKAVHRDLHGQGASHSRLLYAQKLYEFIFAKTNAEFSLAIEKVYWETFLKHVQWRPGMQEFLQKAKDLKIKMCVVTDLTAGIQLQKWIKLELQNYMDFMVSSEEAGIEKPKPYIFELALQKLGLTAQEVLMVGDSEEKDIQGAMALGIKTIRIK